MKLPGNQPREFRFRLNNADYLQFAYLQAFHDMEEVRLHDKTMTTALGFVSGIIVVLLAVFGNATILWTLAIIGMIVGLYYLYHFGWGYKRKYVKLTRQLAKARQTGDDMYETQDCMIRFLPNEITYGKGSAVKTYSYDRVEAAEETDRIYILFVKPARINPLKKMRIKRRIGLEALLIPKRGLGGPEGVLYVVDLINTITETNNLSWYLETHPFEEKYEGPAPGTEPSEENENKSAASGYRPEPETEAVSPVAAYRPDSPAPKPVSEDEGPSLQKMLGFKEEVTAEEFPDEMFETESDGFRKYEE